MNKLRLACIALLPLLCGAGIEAQEKPAVWFPDIRVPVDLGGETGKQVARYAADRLLTDGGNEAEFPQKAARDDKPRMVFLSLCDGKSRARTARGGGPGLKTALDRALAACARLKIKDPAWLKLDVVQVGTAEARGSAVLPLGLDPSLAGLGFDRATGIAFLPEELASYFLVGPNDQLLFGRIVAYLKDNDWRQGRPGLLTNPQMLNLYRFSTESFFTDGKTVFRLQRGHRMFESIGGDLLMDSARAAGEYLLEAMDETGRFVYEYDPTTDTVADAYNILRHAGTVYSMLELYETTEDKRLLEAAERGLEFLQAQVRPAPNNGEGVCVVEDDAAKLGGAALAVLAMAKHAELTGERHRLPTMRKLAAWMLARQQAGGGFARHKVTWPQGEDTGFVSEYYPGEAIFALMRLHALTGDEPYLDAADSAARYIVEVRDKGLPPHMIPHDHWLLYGLAELYPLRKREVYLDHVLLLGGVILASQHLNPAQPDWRGGFGDPPRTPPTATRAEGLLAAHRMLKMAGRDGAADRCLRGAALAAAFLLHTQSRPPRAMYMVKPRACLGGFPESLTSFDMRIDYTQHAISALLALRKAAGQE